MTTNEFQVACDAPMNVGECPLWHPTESALYWVDIPAFAIHRLHPASGAHQEWRMDSEPACLALHASGGLVVALRRGFVHFDPATGEVNDIAAAPYDTSTTRFNDGRVDPAGRFWVGTIYEPRNAQAAEMYCLEKGQVRLKWSGGMMNSNGLAFSLHAHHMYHADTAAHRISRYTFDAASGSAAKPNCFRQFSTDKAAKNYGGRPDGAAVDSDGNYWVAMFEGGRILKFAPDGTQLAEIKLPLRCPTMVAFGGDDLRTLYITSAGRRPQAELDEYPLSGRVLALRMDVAGRAENAYQP